MAGCQSTKTRIQEWLARGFSRQTLGITSIDAGVLATWTGFGGVRHSTRPKSVPVMLSSCGAAVRMPESSESGELGLSRSCIQRLMWAEQRFVLSEEEGTSEATRVLVHVRPCAFVAKDDLRTIPELQGHQIITAPMGTVFPISDLGWDALRRVLPPVPEVLAEPRGALPQVFAWAQRAKGVLPMPGGYAGYLDSLRAVCALVEEERPSTSELDARLEALLEVTSTAARLRRRSCGRSRSWRVKTTCVRWGKLDRAVAPHRR